MIHSEFQIIDTPLKNGITFLEASAGTGKTYTISKIIVRLVVEKQIPISEILVMTFTEAATKELKARVRSAIQSTLRELTTDSTNDLLAATYLNSPTNATRLLRKALATFDEAAIFTIHGFCNRVLKEFAFESNRLFEPTLIKEQRPLWLETIQDHWRSHLYSGDPFNPPVLSFYNQSPTSLLETFLKLIRYPDIDILPSVSENQYAESQKGLKEIWRKLESSIAVNKAEIRDFLGDGSLFKKALSDQISIIQETLQGEWGSLPRFQTLSALKHLSLSNVRSQFYKKHQDTSIPSDFFELAQQWNDAADSFVHQHSFYCFRQVELLLKAKKQNDNLLTFDDLLSSILETLDSASGTRLQEKIQASYQAVLVDEFQDTDSQQTELFKRLFTSPQHSLFFIGDPKQAIYKFRGADIYSYLRARNLATQIHTLSTNWRSSSALVQGINAIFARTPNPFLTEQIPYLPSKAALDNSGLTFKENPVISPLKIVFHETQDSKPIPGTVARPIIQAAMTQEILKLLHEDYRLTKIPIKPADIAILTRSNREAEMVKTALAENNLPAVIFSDQTVFESNEMDTFLILLNVLLKPHRLDWVKSLYASPWFEWTAQDIHERNLSSDGWNEIQTKYQQFHDRWLSEGIAVCLDEWIRWSRIQPRLLKKPGGERSTTNLLHIIELLSHAESEFMLSPMALFQWVIQSVEKPDRERDDFVMRLESDDQAIQIVTIHKSKGLQYPIVFVPFAWGGSIPRAENERIYHRPENNNKLVFDCRTSPSTEDLDNYTHESLSDACRLLYVALTRAQHLCYLFWGDYKDQESSAIAHILGDGQSPDSAAPKAICDNLQRENLGGVEIIDTVKLSENKYAPYQRFQSVGSLAARPITRTPDRGFSISSFSSLASGFKDAIEDKLNEEEYPIGATHGDEVEKSILNFPKGTVTGNLIHNILEAVDLSDSTSVSEVTRQLGSNSKIEDRWIRVLEEHLIQILDCGLPDAGSLTLNKLSNSRCLKEAEFHFPTRNTSTKALLKTFHKITKTHYQSTLPNLENWTEYRLNGFLRGFIDLTFEWEDRIYLLDWKSNWLGNQIEDYNQEAISQSMAHHSYFLQYHLYTVASLRYLKFRNPDFNYDTQFGGVYYLFIRGMHRDYPGNGIYFDRPSLGAITELDQVFQST